MGLAMATWLAGLAWLKLPCWGGWLCGQILHGRYGKILHLPVGVYAAALWIGAILGSERIRRWCLLALALGSIYFVGLQAVVLRQFCPWCLLHAGLTWIAFALRRTAPARWSMVAAFAMAAIGLVGMQRYAAAQSRDVINSALRGEAIRIAKPWFGPLTERSSVLVVSLDCPACLDLLAALAQAAPPENAAYPALLFKSSAGTRELTIAVVAAVLSQGGGSDAFATLSAVLVSQRELVLGNPQGAAVWLGSVFPQAAAQRGEAERLARRHQELLERMHVTATPMLVPGGRAPRTRFAAGEVFAPSL